MRQPTLVDLFQESVEANAGQTAMRSKRDGGWQDTTYEALGRKVEALAGALIFLGVEPGDRVAIWSGNRPEWVIADYAIQHVGGVTVPVYETLPGDQARYILEDAGAKAVFVEDEAKLDTVLERRDEMDALEHIFLMRPVPGRLEAGSGKSAKGVSKEAADTASKVAGFDELLAQGETYNEQLPDELAGRIDGIDAADLATLIYTSGTTGDPKGVMLTHGNLASNVQMILDAVAIEAEVHLAFLPLAHSFARMGDEFVAYSTGSTVCFAEGIDELAENMRELEPTVMLSVPRLYEKMHQRILDRVAGKGAVAERLFNWATSVGWEAAQRRIDGEGVTGVLALKLRLADRLVLDQVREATGGRLRFFVSGGAALDPDLMRFFASVDLWIMQGYGLTETSPVICCNTPEAYRIGSVGRPPDEIKVRVDEEVWDGPDGEGEIQVHGPNVTEGYHGLEDETEALFTGDGWLRTGDIGRIDADGFLYITDRLKRIFKTAYGKYIVPNRIEGKLKQRPFIEQAVVVGEDRRFVSVLVGPDLEQLEAWADEQGIAYEAREDLVGLDEVHDRIWEEVARVNEELARYESIKKMAVLERPLDEEHGELTPTLKVKRRVIEDRYADLIEAMYEDE